MVNVTSSTLTRITLVCGWDRIRTYSLSLRGDWGGFTVLCWMVFDTSNDSCLIDETDWLTRLIWNENFRPNRYKSVLRSKDASPDPNENGSTIRMMRDPDDLAPALWVWVSWNLQEDGWNCFSWLTITKDAVDRKIETCMVETNTITE